MFKRFYMFVSLLLMFSVSLAQSLSGGQMNGLTTNSQNQWFFNQERMSQPLSSQVCLANNGVYKNTRLYLSSDVDSDGLKDYSTLQYLKDNMIYEGDPATTYRVALINVPGVALGNGSISQGTTVYYYTPPSNTGMLGLYWNSQYYNLDARNAWYRQSKIAPINQRVRAVTSDPFLFEQPQTNLNPSDRYSQVVYRVRYSTYRGIDTNNVSNYQTFPVANANDFGSVTSVGSRYLSNPIVDNAGGGPLWPSNYSPFVSNPVQTQRIVRGQEQEHAYECINYNVSRCGDGFIDVSNQQPVNGATTQNYPISDAGVNEQCDPGASASFADDIMPNGLPATASYNCSPTCVVNNTPNLPVLSIQKFQGTGNSPINNIQTAGNPMVLQAGEDLWYRLRITNTGGPATNLELKDDFDSSLLCTYQSINPVLATVPSLAPGGTPASTNFSLVFPTFPSNSSYDVIIQCDRTTVVQGDTILNDFRLPAYNNLTSNEVAAVEDVVINPPQLTIDKQQRLLPSGTFTDAPLSYNSPANMEFRITISNAAGAGLATNIRLDDQLPPGFVPNNTTIPCSSSPVPSVTCTYGLYLGDRHVVSDPFTLQPGTSRVFLISGTLTTNTLTTTENIAYLQSTVDFSIIGQDRVAQNPQTVVVPPVLTSTKLVRNFTKNIPNAAYAQADTQGTAVPVSGGDTVRYQFLINNTGGPVTQPVTITDTFPAGLLITDISIQGSSLPASSLPLTPSPVPFSFNISVPDSVVNNGNGQVTVVITATVPTNLTNGYYLNYHSLSYDGATSLDPGVDDRAYIVVGNNLPGTGNLVIEKTYLEGTAFLEQINRNPGQAFVMQLVVTNTGTASVTGVYVRDICDPRITCISWSYFYSDSPNVIIPGTPILGNTIQTPNLAPANGLAPNQSVVIRVQGIVNTSAEGTTVPNTGYVYMLPGFTTPVDNDSATIFSPTLQRSFTFAKSASGSFSSGSIITYTLSFCNSGQTNITSYTLMDPLSFSFQYIPGSTLFNSVAIPGNPTISSSNILTWGCGTTPNVLPSNCLLTPGQCATLNFNVRVVSVSPPSPVPSGPNILNTPAVAQ